MGSLSLLDDSVVYMDTSVAIYSVEQVEGYAALLQPLWNNLQTGNLRVLSSELILLESLVLLLRLGNEELVNAYEQLLLSSRVQLLPAIC